MLEYTWQPRKTLINPDSAVTIKDLNQNVVTPPQAPVINGRNVTIYVAKEGRYFVSIKSQTATTTHRIDVNDTSNDTGPGITSPLADPQRPGTFVLGGERILGETELNARYASISAPSNLPAGITGVNRFDPQTQVYNLKQNNFRKTRAAIGGALAGTGIAKIYAYGDSTTEGYLATPTPYIGGWPAQLRRRIAARTTNTGTGMCYVMGFTNGDTRWSFSGTWTWSNNGPYGLAGTQQATRYSSTVGSTVTFTPDVACDSFTIYYVKNSASGTFSASVDGGTAVTENAYNASNALATKVIPAGASGMHAITITVPTDSKVFSIVGIGATNGTTGIRVSQVARGGTKAVDLVTTTSAPLSSLNMAINYPAPDLSIFSFGINEYNGVNTVASYTTALQTAITNAKISGDVLLVSALPISDQTRTPTQEQYRQALYTLADANDVPLLDLKERWGSYAISNATPISQYVDLVHPNTKGYGDIASAVFDTVMRGQ